jgi:hypothetical protein
LDKSLGFYNVRQSRNHFKAFQGQQRAIATTTDIALDDLIQQFPTFAFATFCFSFCASLFVIPTRHKTLPASSVFIYDSTTKRLLLKVDHGYDHLKQLHRQLYKDILERHTVRLAPHLWSYILHETSIDSVANGEDSFLSQITSGQNWQKYCSQTYRLSSYTSRPYLAPTRLAVFWRSTMLLQARSMWYKAMLQKLPTRLLFHQMGIIDSPACLLCRADIEDMDHLLATCSIRWEIWISALSLYYPDLSFVPSDILATIQLSPTPSSILNHKRFYTILSTIQWCIWKAYWNFVFDQQPVRLSAILKTVITNVSVLLSPALDNGD